MKKISKKKKSKTKNDKKMNIKKKEKGSIFCFDCDSSFETGNQSSKSWLTCEQCPNWTCYACLPQSNRCFFIFFLNFVYYQ